MNDRVHDQVDELMQPALEEVAALPDELSVAQATEFLMVGVDYVRGLLDSGELASRGGSGSSRRAAKSQVLAWHRQNLTL